MKIIGVTGTNGKTSTVQFIYRMLEGMGHKTAVVGTLGIEYEDEVFDAGLTTPAADTLKYHMSKMEAAGVEYLVMEVSSHALTQNRVKDIIFDVGVFTNLTQDHLDYHGTFENYKKAKYKLQTISKNMVFNIDDAAGEEFFHKFYKPDSTDKLEEHNLHMKNLCNDNDTFCGECMTIATKCDCADLSASRIELQINQTEYLLDFLGTKTHVKVPIPGLFSVYNTMCAMAVMYLLGFTFDEIVSVVPEIRPVKGRAQLLEIDQDFLVMIDFAHTPDALENILSMLRDVYHGRIITVFGCGGERDKTKRPIMGEVVAKYSDFIYLTSDNPRNESATSIMMDALPPICESGKPYRAIENREKAIVAAVKNASPGDLILLAGKGHESYQIIGDEKIPFDEEKIVRKALHF